MFAPVKIMQGRRRRALCSVAAVGVVLLASACSGSESSSSASGGGLEDGLGSRAENRDFVFFEYYDPATEPTYAQAAQGARDAAELANINLTEQNAGGQSSRMLELVQSVISNKPAAIFLTFSDTSYDDAVCEAHDAGIAVYAWGIGPTGSALENGCVDAFIGQDFTAVGRVIGERLLQEVDLQAGDKVLCPVEQPTATYAVQRAAGVNEALASAGVECEILETTGADEQALNAMTTWLGANQDVKAIVPLGGTPHRNAVAAEDATGVTVPIVGFDTSPQVIDGIESGRIVATADQQPYVQGFQAVMEASLAIDFGLAPADINSGGNALVDKSNVSDLSDAALQGVRW